MLLLSTIHQHFSILNFTVYGFPLCLLSFNHYGINRGLSDILRHSD